MPDPLGNRGQLFQLRRVQQPRNGTAVRVATDNDVFHAKTRNGEFDRRPVRPGEAEVEYLVQVNGEAVGKIRVPRDAPRRQIVLSALEKRTLRWLALAAIAADWLYLVWRS